MAAPMQRRRADLAALLLKQPPPRPSRFGWAQIPAEPTMRALNNWGWTSTAELWNGRLAMLGFAIAIATELLTGQGVLQQLRTLLPHG